MPDDTADRAKTTSILAFDFGLRRIGIAIGQTVTGSASPLGIVGNSPNGPDHDQIERLINEWRPDRLVVGMPQHTDGSPSDISKSVHSFIAQLARYDIPVATVDERHTSKEAEAALRLARQSGSRGRIKNTDIDAAAAVLIAERYLATLTP